MADTVRGNNEDEVVVGITKDNLWAYAYVEKLIKMMRYGDLQVTFRIHEGQAMDLMTTEFKRLRKPQQDKQSDK